MTRNSRYSPIHYQQHAQSHTLGQVENKTQKRNAERQSIYLSKFFNIIYWSVIDNLSQFVNSVLSGYGEEVKGRQISNRIVIGQELHLNKTYIR